MTKILELQLQHQYFSKYSGLISLRIDWFDLFAIQGTLRSHPAPYVKGINSLVFRLLYCPALTMEHDTGKTIALTIQTFVGRVMSLIFNALSSFVMAFCPRSKPLLISWLQSPCEVILESNKSQNLSLFPPFHSLFAMNS